MLCIKWHTCMSLRNECHEKLMAQSKTKNLSFILLNYTLNKQKIRMTDTFMSPVTCFRRIMSLTSLLGLCVWKPCEKGVKSVWKKGTMWNQCWQKYKFTTSAFHMHVNFLTCVWNFVIHVKNFCHMCELFFHAFYYMWNLFIHVKQFCHACELQISHA